MYTTNVDGHEFEISGIEVEVNGPRDILKGQLWTQEDGEKVLIAGTDAFLGFRTDRRTDTMDNLYGVMKYFDGHYKIMGKIILELYQTLSREGFKEVFNSILWLDEDNFNKYNIKDKKDLYNTYSTKCEAGSTMNDYLILLFAAMMSGQDTQMFIDREELKGNTQIINDKIAIYNYRDYLYSWADYGYVYNLETDSIEVYRSDFDYPQFAEQNEWKLRDENGDKTEKLSDIRSYTHKVFEINRDTDLNMVETIFRRQDEIEEEEGPEKYYEEIAYDSMMEIEEDMNSKDPDFRFYKNGSEIDYSSIKQLNLKSVENHTSMKTLCMECGRMVGPVEECIRGSKSFIYGENFHLSGTTPVCSCGGKFEIAADLDMPNVRVLNYTCRRCGNQIGEEHGK